MDTANKIASIGKPGPTVDLTPVFNDYENREDIMD